MDIDVERSNGITTVALAGDLDLSAAPGIRQAVTELIEGGDRRIVLDLARVPYVDSSGLGALVVLLKHARAAGGDIRVASLQPDVRSIFEMTRLVKMVSVHDTREDAWRSWA